MLSKRRLAKPALVLIALAGLAVALSACTVYKLGSLQVSQPGGIGSVRVHFVICTNPETMVEGGPTTCAANDGEGQAQAIVGIAVPKGSSAPATITATPLTGGAPIVFTRNDQAAQEMAAASAALVAQGEIDEAWPPPGTEGIGYLSAPFTEEKGAVREWSFDGDFGLPAAADGGSFGGPFATAIVYGYRGVGGSSGSPDRPVDCITGPGDVTEESAFCLPAEKAQIGTSDLKIAPAPRASAFLGGKGTLAFPLDFASTAAALPSFDLTASSTLPKAKVTLPSSTFAPGAVDPATLRSPAATGTVNVKVPNNAKPGLYDVTLTATTPQGGSVSQVAKLKVAKAKIKLGGVKLNKAKGTAILSVKVPGAGTLTVSGKGLAKKKAKAKKAKRLKILVKPNAKTKALLAEEGQAKVKAKITFKPTGATAVVKSKSIVLEQG
ncbi:MAG TPA: hypothetical protein VLI94_10910 [Solirubrobacterales bacterium]|nr:hypothetical protein [Solirubrobacterales bacterium]